MPSLVNHLEFLKYRVGTVFKSFKTLYTLPQEKIDAFMNSYEIYDHDWADPEAMMKAFGADYTKEISKRLVDYYCVLNHLCAVGQVEKMYIPPAIDLKKSIIANQALFEKKMAKDLGLKKGSKILDIGCGRGRVANHISSMTKAQVTGINIDPDQLEAAKRYTKKTANKCQFQHGDVNVMPFAFPDGHFDAIYEIQCVFSLAQDLEKAFKEIHRLLKPGGKFACLEWVNLDKYDPKNSHHADLMRRIKPLIGAIGTCSAERAAELMKKTGFEIKVNENASLNGLQAPLIENADKFFTRITKLLKFLVNTKILPSHFQVLFDRLVKDGQAFVEADRMGLVTTSHYIVAQKT